MLELIEHIPYNSRPGPNVTSRLLGYGTPGETVAFSFSIKCNEDINEIEILTSSLVNGKEEICSKLAELYVVKSWNVSGVGVTQSQRMTVSELLLKDDRTFLDDGYCEHPTRGTSNSVPLWHYKAPSIRLMGNANTSLFAGEQKQIWLSLKIPQSTPAGKYTGTVQMRISRTDCLLLPLELKVLSFELKPPRQDLLMWYRGSIDPRQAQFYVSPELFKLQLEDIYNHGFRSISVCEQDRVIAQQAIDIAEQIGFDRHIVFRSIPPNSEALRFKKLTPVYFLSDEMDAVDHQRHAAYCKILNWKSMATLRHIQFVKQLEDDNNIGHTPNIISLDLANNKNHFTDQYQLRDQSLGSKSCRTYYHWLSHMEKPNLHRLLAGFYLWKAGADGIAPYCYQHPPIFPFTPFDDFDAWEPNQYLLKFRDRMTTYPAYSGIIPTLQWEGLREGIVDLSYLTTLEDALTEASNLLSHEAKALVGAVRKRRDHILSCIEIANIEIESTNEIEPYTHLSTVDYNNFRQQIALDIGILYDQLKGIDKNYHLHQAGCM